MSDIRDPANPKQATLLNSKFRFAAPTTAGGPASSRPAKRYKSVESENPSTPVAPQTAPHKRTMAFADPSPTKRVLFASNTAAGRSQENAPVAPMAPMAPMAQMDVTPPSVKDTTPADVVLSIEEPPVVNTPSFFGRIVGVFTGNARASADVSPSRNVASARKRSIEEVEGSPTRQRDAKQARSEDIGNDTAVEHEDQLPDSVPPVEQESSGSVVERERSVSLGNATKEVAADEPAPAAVEPSATPVSKPKEKAKPKTTPTTSGRRARKSNVALGTPAKKAAESKAGKKEPEVAQEEEAREGEEAEGIFEIEKIIGHRLNAEDETLLDVHVSWKTDDPAGELTWEPEANVQEDAPGVLFQYWRTVKGGRASVLNDPDMWHVLGVKNHKVVQTTGKVLLQVVWIGSSQRSWEPEEAAAGYAKEHVENYWAEKGGRDAVLGQVAAPKKPRGRPPKSASAASSKAATTKQPAKAPAKKATKDAAQPAKKKAAPTKAAAAPTRATRSSRR